MCAGHEAVIHIEMCVLRQSSYVCFLSPKGLPPPPPQICPWLPSPFLSLLYIPFSPPPSLPQHTHTHTCTQHILSSTPHTQAQNANDSGDHDSARMLGWLSLCWNIGVYIFYVLATIAWIVAVAVVVSQAARVVCSFGVCVG